MNKKGFYILDVILIAFFIVYPTLAYTSYLINEGHNPYWLNLGISKNGQDALLSLYRTEVLQSFNSTLINESLTEIFSGDYGHTLKIIHITDIDNDSGELVLEIEENSIPKNYIASNSVRFMVQETGSIEYYIAELKTWELGKKVSSQV